MIITICGSMTFHKEMRDVKEKLEATGHQVFVPKGIALMDRNGYQIPLDESERIEHKIMHDFIREHFRKIEQAQAILVLNYTKKNIKNYIGGNTFLEMGYAYGLNKKIFLLNPIPHMDYFTEMQAMQPVVISGDFSLIK